MLVNPVIRRTNPLLWALLLGVAITSTSAMAEVSGEIAVTNDYRFRGVSQTAGDFAVQASLDWSHDSGFFVGAWASNVEFDEDGTPKEDQVGADFELDVYLGYAGEINDNLAYDITLLRYMYPGDNVSQDYNEISFGLEFSDFRAAYWYTNDYSGSDLDYHYAELNYSYEFAENWSLDLHLGYNFGDAPDDDMGKYLDYSIGVSTEIAGFGLSVAWLDTDIDSDAEISSGTFQNDGTVLASVSYAF